MKKFTRLDTSIMLTKTISLQLFFILFLSCPLWGASSYRCMQDTYLDAAYPDDNFGGSDRLLIANNNKPGRALLKFAVPEWAQASNIKTAELVLYSAPWTGGSGGETSFEVYALTRSWTEGNCKRYNDPTPDDGATWNQYLYSADNSSNRWTTPGGDFDGSISIKGTLPLGNEWGPFSIDVTSLVKKKLNSIRNYGFLLKHPLEDGAGGWQNFSGRDSSGYDPPRQPYLKIEFIEPPANNDPSAPSAPSPEDNASGITTDVVLGWNAGDPDPDDILTYDVYFGLPGAMALVSQGQTAATYNPGILLMATAYEWQIVVKDNNGGETKGPVWSFTTVATGIASITPESASPFYFKEEFFIPRPIIVSIKGELTHFLFPLSRVSFDDEGINVLFSLPLSSDMILAAIVVNETARPGLHAVTVTTGSETASGADLFEVKKYWRGEEKMTVKQDADQAVVSLKGLPVCLFKEKEALRLSDIVDASEITDAPGSCFYNLIANDGYSLERGIILAGWGTGLPSWQDMQKGYLYQTESFGLMAGWEDDTVGGQIGQAYNVKWMEGGIIEMRQQDIVKQLFGKETR